MAYEVFYQKSLLAEKHRAQGFEFMVLKKNDEAIKEHLEAKRLHQEIRDWGGLAGDITNIAIVYEKKGDMEKALQLHHKALSIDLKISYKPGLKIDYSNLSRIFMVKGDMEKALYYQNELLKVLIYLGDLEGVAGEYRDRGFLLQRLERLNEAIAAHMAAKETNEKIENWEGLAGDLTNIALIYEQRGEDEKALKLHHQALEIDERVNFKKGLKIDYTNLSRLYSAIGDISKARFYNKCLHEIISDFSKEEKNKEFHVETNGLKAQIKIFKKSQNSYSIGYSFPSPIRNSDNQFPTMVNDVRLLEIADKIDIITSSINISRKLRNLDSQNSDELTRQISENFIELGMAIYAIALPAEIKRIYKKLQTSHALELGLSDTIVQYPWELMHDGKNFFCLNNSIGRYVISDVSEDIPYRIGEPQREVSVLIIGDPCKDYEPYYNPPYEHLLPLPGARQEAERIAMALGDIEGVKIKLLTGSQVSTVRMIAELSSSYDIIHFSGHAKFSVNNPIESGFLLHDGLLKAYEIMQCIGTQEKSPLLAFINACESSRESNWKNEVQYVNQVFGLASAFLKNGVNYIGSMWPIHDDSAVEIALNFYKAVFEGQSFGNALREARVANLKKYGESESSWASYVLYGDPTFVIKCKNPKKE